MGLPWPRRPLRYASLLLLPFSGHRHLCRLVYQRADASVMRLPQGVKAVGGLPVPLKGNAKKMQETYNTFKDKPDDEFALSPTVAIVPNTAALKEVMSGLCPSAFVYYKFVCASVPGCLCLGAQPRRGSPRSD